MPTVLLVHGGRRSHLRPVGDGLFVTEGGLSDGLLPGEQPILSINDFPLIGISQVSASAEEPPVVGSDARAAGSGLDV
ncbi:hypothetical protein [Actinopolymorpha sp. B9G3]|uniref:hypothetical protein n=1 Tax=Actinopolymorpha sp. B9G3 TaxID=3158970 RepID=UPI0032D8DE06